MKILINNYIVHPIVLAIHAFQGLVLHPIKNIMTGLRSFLPRKRKFYYHKEQAAYKAVMEVKKNTFPGQGPPL